MEDKIERQLIDPDAGMVETTADEVWRRMVAHGSVMTQERGGRLYRIIDPWERGGPNEISPPPPEK